VLQRRSEAIKNTINRYNTQAAKLDPPRPPLSWKEIVNYTFIGEFNTLCHSQSEVYSQPWAQTAHHEATIKYFKLCRACEEVIRLNIEVRRLRTSIHDESIHTQKTISLLLMTNPDLAFELQHRWKLHNAINHLHVQHLDAIKNLSVYTGVHGIGTCLASASTSSSAVGGRVEGNEHASERVYNDVHGVNLNVVDDDEAEQEGNHDLKKVTDFVLTIVD
jgi:hypothetical protein